jgi:iron complex transport system ATP-binding protein
MKDGKIVKTGTGEEVISRDVLRKVFQIDAEIGKDPRTKKTMCITYNLLRGEEKHEKITAIPAYTGTYS